MVRELVPPGSAVMEAGCGHGEGSLVLARLDLFEIRLLDFSENALKQARQLFDQEQVQAKEFILGDVFTPGDLPMSDLVFNAGSLEHYAFDEQVAFVRGMAKMSRRYVLVLWPNRECYWYWIWRIRKASAYQWPYGKEVPSTDMTGVMRAAGITPIGHRPVGAASVDRIIATMPGLTDDMREDILRIHRSPLLPDRHRAYLMASLGVVGDGFEVPAGWGAPERDEMKMAELTASLADALSLAVAAQRAVDTVDKRAQGSALRLARDLDRTRNENLSLKKQLSQMERRLRDLRRSPLRRIGSRARRFVTGTRT